MGEKDKCLEKWPTNAFSADDVAKTLSGLNPPENLTLSDVYPPNPMPEEISQVSPRGDTMQILAQFECFLSGGNN